MQQRDLLRMCVQNLLRRKARTLLTVLGVLIGCCSIVIMVSIGIGMKENQERLLREMGDLTIITVSAPQGGHGKSKLDDAAVKKLRGLAGVTEVTPRLSLENYTVKLYAGAGNRYAADWSTVAGLQGSSLTEMGYTLLSGSPLGGKAGEALAGQYLAYSFKDTFRPEGSNTVDRWSAYTADGKAEKLPPPYFDPLKTPITLVVETDSGQKVTMPLTVTGTVKEDYNKGPETSEGLILDLADAKKLLEQIRSRSTVRRAFAYSSLLVKVSGISQVAGTEEQIRKLGYNTSSMESIRKPMEKEARQKQLMLGGLGAISLFVAALGITNTMIMSISERTKEIGIMKALGCYVRDIRRLFLMEAGAIGLLGGLAGCVLSFVISVIVNLVSLGGASPGNLAGAVLGGEGVTRISVIPLWLMAFGIVFSIVIGVCSGYYPANRAVRIPALEAIKSE